MFHPSWLGIDLRKFFLSGAADVSLPVEEKASGAGSALVHGNDIPFFVQFVSLLNLGLF
jgi:hypothetical protein